MLSMGKSTISMAIFNSYVNVYQRVYQLYLKSIEYPDCSATDWTDSPTISWLLGYISPSVGDAIPNSWVITGA